MGNMTDLSEKDKSQISAETARTNSASKRPITEIIAFVDRYNGAGLTPAEVLALRFYITRLENQITIKLGYPIED